MTPPGRLAIHHSRLEGPVFVVVMHLGDLVKTSSFNFTTNSTNGRNNTAAWECTSVLLFVLMIVSLYNKACLIIKVTTNMVAGSPVAMEKYLLFALYVGRGEWWSCGESNPNFTQHTKMAIAGRGHTMERNMNHTVMIVLLFQ